MSQENLGANFDGRLRTVTSGNADDRQLMGEVSAGSVAALGQLYDRFSSRAYRVAYSVCRDEGRAHDAVRDAFLHLWRTRTTSRRERGTVAAWLLTVVRDRAIDLARRDRDHATQRDTTDRLLALAALPDEQQEVIALAYYGQLSHTEIATQLRLPPGTVKDRMRLGLQKLRSSLDQAA